MKGFPLVLPMLSALLAAGCASGAVETASAPMSPAALDWRQIATDSDRHRIRQWRSAWMKGLAQARVGGHAADVAREGVLLQPDAAAQWRDPPEGEYDCRVIKVGSRSGGTLDYVSYPSFTCRIRDEAGMMSFAKLTGSQRPLGMFLPGRGDRMIFLGTLQLGDERRALTYGRDRERDMVGVLERIGEGRWRLVFPYPHFESTIDVLELTPKA